MDWVSVTLLQDKYHIQIQVLSWWISTTLMILREFKAIHFWLISVPDPAEFLLLKYRSDGRRSLPKVVIHGKSAAKQYPITDHIV